MTTKFTTAWTHWFCRGCKLTYLMGRTPDCPRCQGTDRSPVRT